LAEVINCNHGGLLRCKHSTVVDSPRGFISDAPQLTFSYVQLLVAFGTSATCGDVGLRLLSGVKQKSDLVDRRAAFDPTGTLALAGRQPDML
jgi:hypothetical protein